MKESLKKTLEIIMRPKSSSVVPVVSGAAALLLVNKIISSNLDDWRFVASLICALVIFIISVILFAYLKRMEKEKDQYLLSTVGKIVEDVFKHYGVAMARNAAGPTTANQMNPIMQTIVDLVKGLKQLANKTYTKN